MLWRLYNIYIYIYILLYIFHGSTHPAVSLVLTDELAYGVVWIYIPALSLCLQDD